ncbi:MAG: NUDIX domain-containing protein [Candidatus Taylorbacteria bacterium]|nr:NUDIX domain-containing protein [Candidatus Taylorbacteria bacterium]
MDIKDKELHRITSTAIIHKDGKYLIIKRAPHKKVFPNRWIVPGGGLTTDDYTTTKPTTKDGQWYNAIEISLRREVKEEVSLEIGKLEYLVDIAFITPANQPVICLSYFAPYLSGEVKLDEDAVDYKWLGLEELKNFDLVAGIDHEIEMVDTILKKR